MKNGHEYLTQKNYDKALLEFQAAQIAARECNIDAKEPADELIKVFEGIITQRKEAEKARLIAINSANAIKHALKIAKDEKQRADSALAKAEKLISAFYFYDGKLALALKEIKFRAGRSRYFSYENRYGFINKQGDVVIDYKYAKAEQFDYNGLAKVKRNDEDKNICDYLVDTAGREYKVAYDLTGLNENITALDLRDQKLTGIPEAVTKEPQLKILLFNKNYLESLPPKIGQINRLTALETLDLSGIKLTSLPLEVYQLKNLKTLNLAYNQLTSLLPEIKELQNLQTLDLRTNSTGYLFTVPPEIGQLKNLKNVNFNSIKLNGLPGEFGQLQNLQVLDLGSNYLRIFPLAIRQLKNLQELNLSTNSLEVLPPEIGQLKSLQKLNLYYNELKELPLQIGQLKNLEDLSLENNKLKVLPAEIGQLQNLKTMNLRGNPISKPELRRLQFLLPHCTILVD